MSERVEQITVSPRARLRPDRAGDPLDGLVNLFDLGIVLAVAFLLAALSSLQLSDLLTSKDVSVVRQNGDTQTVITKKNDQVETVDITNQKVVGQGTRVGTVYRLSDGRTVVVEDKGGASAPGSTAPGSEAPTEGPAPLTPGLSPPAATTPPGTTPPGDTTAPSGEPAIPNPFGQ